MDTVELFCGTKSFSSVANNLGYSIFTVDIDNDFNPDLCLNILDLKEEMLPKNIDILWASPPCQFFSVASIGKHWNKDHTPKSENALVGLEILEKTIKLISLIKPKYWFLENPRGKMRKVIDPIFEKYGLSAKRNTVTYCQYGDTRMKPTDIWTSCNKWVSRKMCKNGDMCHVSAPRGSKTGTQGLKNSKERSRVPKELFVEIFKQIRKEES